MVQVSIFKLKGKRLAVGTHTGFFLHEPLQCQLKDYSLSRGKNSQECLHEMQQPSLQILLHLVTKPA